MGHRTIKTTQIYAKMTRKRKVDLIKFLNERNKPQKKTRVKKVEKGVSTATFQFYCNITATFLSRKLLK